MKTLLCPTCPTVKLIKSRAITSNNDPNSGKEYLTCTRCSAKWFMDDPNRPTAVDVKPKQSIWKTLATWGAPHNEPDAFGVLHPMTYVFPPRHDYPSPFLPPSSTPRQSVLIPLTNREPAASTQIEPTTSTAESPPQPASPAPEPSQPAQTPTEQLSPKEGEHLEPQQTPQEINETPPEPSKESQSVPCTPTPEEPPQPETTISPHASDCDMSSGEQARYDLLSKIVNSPLPPFLDSQRSDVYDPADHTSVLSDDHQPSVASKTGSELLSPEEQQLLKTLLKVASSPHPPSPIVYTSTNLSPKVASQDLNSSDSFREQRDNAALVRHRAQRIEQAIQNSPFLSQRGHQTPRSEKWIASPKSTQPKSPSSKHSHSRSSRHSIALPVPPTPYSPKQYEQDAQSLPRSPFLDDQLPLPGALPTLKATPLTPETLSSLSRQSSRHGGSVRSGTLPSDYGSIPATRTARRSIMSAVSIGTRSPLFN